MAFSLSAGSLALLAKAHPDLQAFVKRLIQVTPIDFKVGETARTLARQKQLVKIGASKTLNSRHLVGKDGFSHAVDLHAFSGGEVRWDWPLYYQIASAAQKVAIELDLPIRWGGAWKDLRTLSGPATKWTAGVRFMDGPHYELPAIKKYS
ncbi:M15 family peptidase [Candidatus Parcubacteria bacterium]|nr:MAG: M15 family peptidase [Candidatus Parcubacteria bacterium]